MKLPKALLLPWLFLPALLFAQPEDSLRNFQLGTVNIDEADLIVIYLKPLDDLSLSSHHIPAQRAAATTAEILQSIPSAYIRSYQPGGLSTISLRGTGASHTQLYWLGVPLNAPTLGQNDLSLGLTALQGKPTILPGGSSLKLGSGGLGGAIDFSPPIYENSLPGIFQIQAEGGSFGTLRASAIAQHYKLDSIGRLTASTGIGYTSAQNNFTFQNTTLPTQPIQRLRSAEVRQAAAMQSLRYISRHAGMFNLDAYAQAARRNLPPTMLSTDQGERQEDATIRARLAWYQDSKLGNHTTWAAILRDTMRYQNTTAAIDAPAAFTRIAAQTQIQAQAKPWRRELFTDAAIRVQHDIASAQGIPQRTNETLLSGHANLQTALLRNSTSTLIIREEWRQGQWSLPMATLAHEYRYGIRQAQRIKIQLSHNQHWPTLNDRYWQPGGNPDLRPETALSGVLGITRGHRLLRSFYAVLNAKVHAQQVKDWILWMPSSGSIWTPENIGRVRVIGTETDFIMNSYGWPVDLVLEFSHAFTSARQIDQTTPGDSAQGKQLIYTPAHQARARLHAGYLGWEFTFNANYTGTRFTTRDNSSNLPPFSTIDAQVAKKFLHKVHNHAWRLYLLGQNLTGTRYQSIPWRPMPRQSVYLGIEWKFK